MPNPMNDDDYTSNDAQIADLKAEVERLKDAIIELVEVARLRGDNELPHPCNDPLLWTARMQDAWGEVEEIADECGPTATGDGQ